MLEHYHKCQKMETEGPSVYEKKNIYIYTNEYICIFLLYIIYEYRLHNYITNIFVNITYCINI